MTLHLRLKTTRTSKGYANATLTRFMNYSSNRMCYGFHFYNLCLFFDYHRDLRQYILDNYNVDIGDRKQFWGL